MTALADMIRRTLEECQLTQEELAEQLGVPRGRMLGWLAGSSPRGGGMAIAEQLQRVRERSRPLPDTSMYAQPNEVQAITREWLEALTEKQLSLAGELPISTIKSWEAGEVKVLRRRLDRISSLVEHWRRTLGL